MKKTYYIRLAAALCVAGLYASMLSVAKAEAIVVSPDALSSLQNQAEVNDGLLFKPASPSLFSSSAADSTTVAPSIAFSGYSKGAELPTASGPGQSYSPIQHYSVIPEPTTISCLALGIGALVGFKRLKFGQKK